MDEQQHARTAECGESAGSEPGQALAEYAILLVTVSVVAVTILTSVGSTVSSMYLRASTMF